MTDLFLRIVIFVDAIVAKITTRQGKIVKSEIWKVNSHEYCEVELFISHLFKIWRLKWI